MNHDETKRKYLSEFGLNTYSNRSLLIYPSELDHVEKDVPFHIYMVLQVNKIVFKKNSLIKSDDGLHFSILIVNETNTVEEQYFLPFKEIEIFNSDYEYHLDASLRYLCFNDIKISVLPFFMTLSSYKVEAKVLYVGQSYGEGGERKAPDRLKKHSTLQQILADHTFHNENDDVMVMLHEITPMLLASFDPSVAVHEDEQQHQEAILNNPPLILEKQILNATEAAWIKYFKPKYNEKFKEIFPSPKHEVYKRFYIEDYNLIGIEINVSEYNNLLLYSDSVSKADYHEARYPLQSLEVRRDMFDLSNFLSQKKN